MNSDPFVDDSAIEITHWQSGSVIAVAGILWSSYLDSSLRQIVASSSPYSVVAVDSEPSLDLVRFVMPLRHRSTCYQSCL